MRLHLLPLASALLLAGLVPALGAKPTREAADQPAREQPEPGRVDLGRVLSDPAYAAQFLRDLEASGGARSQDPEARNNYLALRALALAGAERTQEAGAAIDGLLALRSSNPSYYMFAWIAAGRTQDTVRMLRTVEAAAREVPAADRHELYVLMPPEQVFVLAHILREADRDAELDRLYEALGAMDWPGNLQPGSRDSVRLHLVDRRLEQGDRSGAARIAQSIEAPAQLTRLITALKYDGLRSEADPLAALRRSLELDDRATAAAVAAAPGDFQLLIERAQHLRSVGRYADAYAALAPHLADVDATFASGEQGMWAVNEAAYTLIELGRNDEAVALMQRLVAQDIEGEPGLIGPSINFIEILRMAGRHAEALAHGERLRAGHGPRYANAYGRAWIDSGIVCALAGLGRNAEAAPHLVRLRASEEANAAALARGLLCAGAEDEAAALMVRRLGSDDPVDAILALQQYEVRSAAERADPVLARLETVRNRPDVAAALARVGRSLRLPVARTYWGGV